MITTAEAKKLNDVLFSKLEALSPEDQGRMSDAVSIWTRRRMNQIEHIPNRFFLPDMYPAGTMKKLVAEMNRFGYLLLNPAKTGRYYEPLILNDDEAYRNKVRREYLLKFTTDQMSERERQWLAENAESKV